MTDRLKISYDLEKLPLEIKTNNYSGRSMGPNVYFYKYFQNGYKPAGGVKITLSPTPRYLIYSCSYWSDFLTTLPTAAEYIWRITKDSSSGIRLLIHCNGVLVLDFQLSDQTCPKRSIREIRSWYTDWSRDVTKLRFIKYRDEDYSYRPYQGNSCILHCSLLAL